MTSPNIKNIEPKHTSHTALIPHQSVIVTGASGFVGRNLVRQLVEQGYEVYALVRDREKAQTLPELNKSELLHGNICDANITTRFVPNATLIHCAWDDIRDVTSICHLEKHYLSHFNFIKRSIESGVTRIIVTGSCYEYGLQYGPVNASTETKPNTPYSLAKDTLHKTLRHFQKNKPFELIWARLFYMYGAGQHTDSLISLFDKALASDADHFDMSFGEQLFDYSPIESVCEQLIKLINKPDGVYNVCSGSPVSVRRLLEQRMKYNNRTIKLNLGIYGYRKNDSLAIWGTDPVV